MRKKWFAVLCSLSVTALLAAATPVFFHNFTGGTPAEAMPDCVALEADAEGLHLQWKNCRAKELTASFGQTQYLEDLREIRFRMKTAEHTGASLKIELIDSDRNHWQAAVEPSPSGEWAEIVLTPDRFTRTRSGVGTEPALKAGDETMQVKLVLSGPPESGLKATISDFTLCGAAETVTLFEPEAERDIFGKSARFARPVPIRFAGDRTPRVYVAENARHLASTRFRQAVTQLEKEFPGQLGVHFNSLPFPRMAEATAHYNSLGIKTTFENHLTSGYEDWLTNRKLFMTRRDGFTMNDPANWGKYSFRYLWPYHGIRFQEETLFPVRKLLDELQRDGVSEYLNIDYIWPWHGRWGFDDLTVAAFRRDLAGTDEKLMLAAPVSGEYRPNSFWEYLANFTDVEFRPADLGLNDWNEYRPVTEAVAAKGGPEARKNLFLYFALYHYEYLKFLQKIGDEAEKRGILLVSGTNPEDVYNGNDHYLAARVRGVGKLGYEFFGSPLGTYAWYRNMRFFAGNLRRYGKSIYMIGEINNGGHGPTKYDPYTAYALYYDATSAAKPSDYNNQYMESAWDGKLPGSPYHQGRYGHWAAGAHAFLQSHREGGELPNPKRTLVIASRNILELQDGFSGRMTQFNNPSRFLDQLHYPFEAAGKEALSDGFADDAQVLFFAPSEASPMHFAAARKWLDAQAGRTLITHSIVPFHIFHGTVNLKRETPEILWEADKSYNRFLADNNPNGKGLPLELAGVEKARPLSLAGESAIRDHYRLKNGRTLLADDAGLPLISEIPVGKSRILYLHSPLPFGETEAFSRALLDRAMRLAGEAPEAATDPGASVHIYQVPGGNSAVVWDTDAAEAMNHKRYFERARLNAPRSVGLPAEPGKPYLVYSFYSGRLQERKPEADGFLKVESAHSCDIFYWGIAGDKVFQTTLAEVGKVRQKLLALDPAAAAMQIREHGRELLVNGGFETGEAKPDGWTTWFKHRYIKESAEAGTGDRAVALLAPESADCRWYPVKPIPVVSGKRYLFSARVKTAGLDEDDLVELRLERRKDGKFVGAAGSPPLKGNSDWRKLEFVFTADDSATSVTPLLVFNCGGNRRSNPEAIAVFDDVSLLEEQTEAAP
mgnify:CR=1 FL=1